jgi:hypothetical protein
MNGTGDDATLWQLRFPIPVDAVEEVLAVLDDEAQSFATYEEEDGDWHCEIITRAVPDRDRWRAVLEEALGEVAPEAAAIEIEPRSPASGSTAAMSRTSRRPTPCRFGSTPARPSAPASTAARWAVSRRSTSWPGAGVSSASSTWAAARRSSPSPP